MEIWESKPPGTLWATPGLLRVSLKHGELILKINKNCYLLHPVGLDFITLPTLKMPDGQTQNKNTIFSLR
jgi:hypothetical protein